MVSIVNTGLKQLQFYFSIKKIPVYYPAAGLRFQISAIPFE